ncbi:PilZ domain-containing protein [Devosia sp. A8/3-2]|nr:PilZ domain-containing protein [Devosia sp. A8/3-2]
MTPTPKIERRKVPRQAAKVETTTVHEDGIVRKTGTIRNISPEGAKLSFASTEDIPDAAYILIPDRHQIEPYRVVWRSEDEVGLAFTAVEPPKPSKP